MGDTPCSHWVYRVPSGDLETHRTGHMIYWTRSIGTYFIRTLPIFSISHDRWMFAAYACHRYNFILGWKVGKGFTWRKKVSRPEPHGIVKQSFAANIFPRSRKLLTGPKVVRISCATHSVAPITQSTHFQASTVHCKNLYWHANSMLHATASCHLLVIVLGVLAGTGGDKQLQKLIVLNHTVIRARTYSLTWFYCLLQFT